MTAGGFREVDLDLLADYLGGALDGTPDEAVVDRLVAEDPAWAEAHDALAAALAPVGDALASWAGPAPEMPPFVADRIVAALAGAGPGTPPLPAEPTQRGLADPARIGRVPTQPTGGTRRPAGSPDPATGRPGGRGRRWARLAGPVALAAASVVAVGFGLNQLATGAQDGGAADQAISSQAEAGGGAFTIAGAPRRSGTDWTPEALAADDRLSPHASEPAKSFGAGPDAPVGGDGGERLPAVGGLSRLTGSSALADCLTAVSAEHGAGPLTVDLVDYARFQGAPALVVRFVDPSGARWAWVSGPECGVPGSGADTRYRTRVG
ncbi:MULTISPECIES: hypothetical protein [unclassified Micromonospora]|uniref:hypothetical protein n=1 Tax=unclassified Micromonospora TaxID=2617518 RepID=UPI00363FD464